LSEIEIRPYRDDDEPAVKALLDQALVVSPAGGPPSELFRWKHLENPFGRSYMLVAEVDGRVVGLRAFMRWEFTSGPGRLRAVRAVDTATAPGFQGRGIFSRLTRAALDAIRGDVDLVFNTPNEQSGPGYLKMGWRQVGRIPIRVRVRRPLRFARGVLSHRRSAGGGSATGSSVGVPAAEILADPLVEALLEEAPAPGARLRTPRTADLLRWRYGPGSGIGYRAVAHRAGGRVAALAIFRMRSRGALRECSLTELLAGPGGAAALQPLLRGVLRDGGADHALAVTTSGTSGHRATRRSGFLPWRRGPVLMVNQLRDRLEPDPLIMRSWDLSLGDLEVF
jgi:hypothetical protein